MLSYSPNNKGVSPFAQPSLSDEQVASINLTIAFPEGTISKSIEYSDGLSAFSALENLDNVIVSVEKYDFGVFVKSINDHDSSSKKSWIYYINGQAGQTAADQAFLGPGDKVDWKFEEVRNE